MLDEYNAAWYNTDEESIAGNTLSFAPLESGEGVELQYNMTVTDTQIIGDGVVTEVFSWWQGEDSLRVVTTVEDLGIVDTQDIDFIPEGVKIFSTVTNSEKITATNIEFFERVVEEGDGAKKKD